MRATKVREKMAAFTAIVLIIAMAAIGAAFAGWRIPILSAITDALGIGPG
jgi:hypothetical protein